MVLVVMALQGKTTAKIRPGRTTIALLRSGATTSLDGAMIHPGRATTVTSLHLGATVKMAPSSLPEAERQALVMGHQAHLLPHCPQAEEVETGDLAAAREDQRGIAGTTLAKT
jgi:hypothetical protein